MSSFVPTGFYALEKAVLLFAKQLNPDLWNPATMTSAEVGNYEGLGERVHYRDLCKLLRDLQVDEREQKGTVASKKDLIEERLRAYEQAQLLLRAALHAGRVRSFVQISETGRRVQQEAESWAQENAISWFDDGRAFVLTGGAERASFGPYVPGAPDDVNYIEQPKGAWASILIDQLSFDTTAVDSATSAEQRDKGSRPAEYDWDAVRKYTLGQVKKFGVPGKTNKRFPTKADLVTLILNEWAQKDIQLAEPTVRRYVTKWLGEL
jgi:hypothetical protein